MLTNKNVLLGVTASIAAYKSAFIVRELKKAGANVKVILTEASLDFVTPLTLSTLSQNEVLIKMVDKDKTDNQISHVELGLWADLMLIAPVTANSMGKMVSGVCDNLLLATYLSAKCPVYFAPAMDLDMFQHPSTKRNIEKLTAIGNRYIPAQFGELASGLVGEGRMAEPHEIVDFILKDIKRNLPLSDKKVLITAGPTYEKIDPVRFIGNHSSGKMGFHLALQAANMGAEVFLIMGPSYLTVRHSNVNQINVQTANEMLHETKKLFSQVDIAIFSAAVSDFRPKIIAKEKIKKTDDFQCIELERTTDILQELGREKKENQIVVGFALETENEIENATMKLKKKNADLIVLNSLNEKGAGFGHETNKITIIDKEKNIFTFPLKNKMEVAKDVWLKIIEKI